MNRFPLLAALAVLAASAWAPTTGAGEALALRQAVVVEDALIRLGDLFDGALVDPARPIAKAPKPGESLVLDARWLALMSRAYGLDWRPSSSFDQVVVGRASRRIGMAQIKEALLAAIEERGLGGAEGETIEVVIDGNPSLALPTNLPATLTVQQLQFDSRQRRFTARLAAPADGPAAAQGTVTGELHRLVEIPVPRRRLMPGETIAEGDIEWVRRSVERVGPEMASGPEQLIGMAPRRPLAQGEPVRLADLGSLIAVKKGALVTVVLRTALLTATVQGKALDAGSLGSAIRVVNTKSNRVLNATVVDPTTVAVETGN